MKLQKDQENGMVTLEACVSVLFFMIIMFLLWGMFLMYMAQNATAHALLQTSQSLALDNYSAQKLEAGTGFPANTSQLTVRLLQRADILPNGTSYFVLNEDLTKSSADIPAIAKKRFIGYLANGDEDKADTMLKQMKVENGLDGLNFSESEVDGDNLKIIVTYQLNYAFQIASWGKTNVRQETLARLWTE
ncbi:MAG: hypothetical protein IJ642_09905 [Oscillospiraceae bacterium]|nr:hypothetical protein [Oscillospiraceae bacterium]